MEIDKQNPPTSECLKIIAQAANKPLHEIAAALREQATDMGMDFDELVHAQYHTALPMVNFMEKQPVKQPVVDATTVQQSRFKCLDTNAMKHEEGLRLLKYATKDGKEVEWLWNSRDGVSPFGIQSDTTGQQLFHTQWWDSPLVPNFLPPDGMRFFVDYQLSEEQIQQQINMLRISSPGASRDEVERIVRTDLPPALVVSNEETRRKYLLNRPLYIPKQLWDRVRSKCKTDTEFYAALETI